LQLLLNVAFSGGPCPEMMQRFGDFLHKSYREQSFVQLLKKILGCAFRFWSYSNSNIGDHDVCAQIYCENFQVRTEDRILEKILCHKTDLKNWTYIANHAFWHPLPAVDFSRMIGEKPVTFPKIPAVGHLHGGQMCAHSYYIRLIEHSTRNWGRSPLHIFVQCGRKIGILLNVVS